MDSVEQVVDDLGLRDLGDFDGETFIVSINSSDKFSSIYTDISSKFEADDAAGQQFNDTSSMTVFTDDDVEIITNADYDNDIYTISIGRK